MDRGIADSEEVVHQVVVGLEFVLQVFLLFGMNFGQTFYVTNEGQLLSDILEDQQDEQTLQETSENVWGVVRCLARAKQCQEIRY